MADRRVAIVTGASRNIGAAVARRFAVDGFDLVVNARSDSDDLRRSAQSAEEAGARVSVVLGDVAEPDLAQRLVATAHDEFARGDVLVHVPSTRPVQPFFDISASDWEDVFRINASSMLWLCQAALPAMVERGWGRIIGFSGTQMVRGQKSAHVAASKAALIGLVHSLAIEFAPHGVTANAVVPGTIDTKRATEYAFGESGKKAAALSPDSLDLPPIGRLGRPEEVARLCAYLASDDAAYMTGQSLHINGGALTS